MKIYPNSLHYSENIKTHHIAMPTTNLHAMLGVKDDIRAQPWKEFAVIEGSRDGYDVTKTETKGDDSRIRLCLDKDDKTLGG